MAYSEDDGVANPSGNTKFSDIVEQVSRRSMLKSGVGAATLGFFGGATALLAGCGGSDDPAPATAPPAAAAVPPEAMLGFTAIATSTGDAMVVPAGYVAEAILPWGEPLNTAAPAWSPDASQSWQAQEQQVGDNHDGMWFYGFNDAGNGPGARSDEGLLVMNHEYINPEYFYAPGADPADWLAPFTPDKSRKALAAHGVGVYHVRRGSDGQWSHVKESPYNRRITGYTPIGIVGPAAGHALVQTAADPSGTEVLGTVNNCASGWTPWGTYLTCEENFNAYFGWNGARTPTALDNRYGLSEAGFGYRLHTVDPRFDMNVNPNEPNRFGWIVEIDPFAPAGKPVKRTNLGRFKHENIEVVVAADGTVVAYSGDDERNEYIYKFVASGTFDRANPYAAAHRELLADGTLYVARFDAGATAGDNAGRGSWIALVAGQGALAGNAAFPDQASVTINTRAAADAVGATMMDRPEWIAANTMKPGEVYIALTNNNRRGSTPPSANAADGSTRAASARPPVDEANPRAVNNWGHIVRWNEAGGDAKATTFDWDIFVLAGNPTAYPTAGDTRAGTPNVTAENMFNSPDGLAFDAFGRLWIQTDGNFGNAGDFAGQGNNQMLAADAASGEIRRFCTGPSGCEITGVTWTPDRQTMFINIQHPGELGNHPRVPQTVGGVNYADNDIARDPLAFSQWPVAGQRPRAATVVIRRSDGGVIGT